VVNKPEPTDIGIEEANHKRNIVPNHSGQAATTHQYDLQGKDREHVLDPRSNRRGALDSFKPYRDIIHTYKKDFSRTERRVEGPQLQIRLHFPKNTGRDSSEIFLPHLEFNKSR
jgi:hypothetical protein